MQNNKILLYPGGFKPFHDGHLLLLEDILYTYQINNIYIITSNKDRDNISANDMVPIINSAINFLETHYSPVSIYYKCIQGSPIAECYKIVNNSNDNEIFTLLSSNKSNTDYKRTVDFYEGYKVNGKYNKNIWDYDKVYDLNYIPSTYEFYNRNDEYNNENISATILRQDILHNDFNNFKSGYQYMILRNIIDENELLKIFNKLRLKLI